MQVSRAHLSRNTPCLYRLCRTGCIALTPDDTQVSVAMMDPRDSLHGLLKTKSILDNKNILFRHKSKSEKECLKLSTSIVVKRA